MPKSRLKTGWMEKATDKLLCSKNHPSSSKGISQRSAFKRWGFSHKRSSFTLHVSSLLAKVAEAYIIYPTNGQYPHCASVWCKGQTHRPMQARKLFLTLGFCKQTDLVQTVLKNSSSCKLQLPHGSQVTKQIYDCAWHLESKTMPVTMTSSNQAIRKARS